MANNEDVTSKQSAVERMGIKRFDKTLFENLKAQADRSSRRRAHLNVHNNYQDPVQRLFIAMMPDSYVRPPLVIWGLASAALKLILLLVLSALESLYTCLEHSNLWGWLHCDKGSH